MDSLHKPHSGQKVTIRELKECVLGVMDELDRFCRENDIRYFLLGGTMLGAVRHKGYIPWDDDIDVGMFREDYEKFINLYKSEKGYQLRCFEKDPTYYLPFAKLIDPRISLYEEVYKAPEIGAYVDVFQLDYVEKESPEVAAFYGNSILKKLEDLKYMQLRKDRPLWKNALILAGRILYHRSLHKIARDRDARAAALSHKDPTGWVSNPHGAWGFKEVVDAKCFKEAKEYSFEGRSYFGPGDYDTYLSTLYGDYMTPPPPEKQVTHHSFTAIWK